MPPFNDLSVADLRGLTAFVQSLESVPQGDNEGPELTDDEHTQAQALFVQNCSACHGYEGRGNGLSSTTMAPAPTDFGANGRRGPTPKKSWPTAYRARPCRPGRTS